MTTIPKDILESVGLDIDAPTTARASNNGDGRKSKPQPPSDDELASRWVAMNEGTAAFGLDEWWRYGAGWWQRVHPDFVRAEIMEICKAARFEGVRATSRLVSSVTELARLTVRTPDEYFNANQNALVLQNGTLDLKSFTLREHNPADYATVALPYCYDPDATAAHFDYAVYSTIPDAAEFLQEFAGYCLTTDTSLETAVWLYGPRGSGKSTILHGFQTMLGPMVGMLGLAQIERSQFALSDLPGKRLMLATEQPGGYLSASWLLDAIISGEKVRVERKYKDGYDLIPCAKIAWAMNDLPRVADAADGLFRRVKVIRFPALPEADRNTELKGLIGNEPSGLLNWAVEGLRRLRARGHFEIPSCVVSATENFQQENDKAANFVAERCLVGRGGDPPQPYEVRSSALYESYKQWCFDNGHKPESSTRMAREWERLGFTRDKRRDGAYWAGVGLLA